MLMQAGRQIRLAAVRPATITVAEGASTAQWSAGLLNQPGPAHIMDTVSHAAGP